MSIEKFTKAVKSFEENKKKASGYIALSDLKTLDTLLKGADKLGDNFTKKYNKYIEDEVSQEDATDAYIAADNKYEEQKDKIEALRRKHNTDIAKMENTQQKLLDAANKADQKQEAAITKWQKAKSEAINEQKQIQGYVDRFDNALKSFLTAAKALGVKVDIGKYESARNRLDAKTLIKLN